MIRVLLIPWFLSNPDLGMTKYGILGGFQSAGIVLGSFILSLIVIKPRYNYRLYVTALISFVAGVGLAALINNFLMIIILFFIAFFFQFIFNTLQRSTLLLITPQDKRGKVMSFIAMVAMAMAPMGNFMGGILGEFLEPRIVIIGSTVFALIIIFIFVLHPTVVKFINYDPKSDRIDELGAV